MVNPFIQGSLRGGTRMSRRRLLVAVTVTVAVASVGLLRATVSQPTSARAASHRSEVAKDEVAWRRSMQRLPMPGRGCFKAAFPRIKWNRVRCAARRRPKPMAPGRGPRPFTVGHGNNYSAEVTGTMTEAEGSFDSVTAVTSETGALSQHSTTQYNDVYSLQLNAKPFPTPVCSAGGGGCIGWQQFVYASADQQLLIQYWLEFYGPSCPNGWYSDGFDDCYTDGPDIATVAQEPISQLANLRLDGKANASGDDSVMLFIGNNQVTAANMGNMLDLGSAWTGVEFAVVGDCCDTEANFNAGATIVTRTTVLNGTMNAPTCVLNGWTYETNNLSLGTEAVQAGPAPALVATESNSANTPTPSCSSGTGMGDTHLTTFKGLLYDFQASGDFTLAQAPPNFTVQTRQVSGAPTWPNAAVNSAVGTRIGPTRVAICLPNRVEVNGTARTVTAGNPLYLPGGVDVSRAGNAYLIRGPNGERVRADVNPTWIDVFVGLGRTNTPVRGLLANANGNLDQLATSNGSVLTEPFSFDTIYGRYGESWRVKPGQSLLCGREVKPAVPSKPFYAQNLAPGVAQRARAACSRAGVRKGALLDACTLDVAVIGRTRAADAYLGARPPAAVAIVH
jgi:hypothetical protein